MWFWLNLLNDYRIFSKINLSKSNNRRKSFINLNLNSEIKKKKQQREVGGNVLVHNSQNNKSLFECKHGCKSEIFKFRYAFPKSLAI